MEKDTRPKADPDHLPPMESNHHMHYDKAIGEPLFDTGLHLLNFDEAKAKYAFIEAQIFKYDADLKNELLSKAPNMGLNFRELEIKRRLNFLRPSAARLNEFIKTHDKPTGISGVQAADTPKPDRVNRPSHYTSHPSGVECITITEHYDFCVGNAIKYLWRCGLKVEECMTPRDKEIEDLKKAVYYINRKINNLEK